MVSVWMISSFATSQTVLDYRCDEIHNFRHTATPSHDQWTYQSALAASATLVLLILESDYEREQTRRCETQYLCCNGGVMRVSHRSLKVFGIARYSRLL